MKNKVPQHGRQWNSIRFFVFFVYFSPVVVFLWELKEFRMTRRCNPTLFVLLGKTFLSRSEHLLLFKILKMMNQFRTIPHHHQRLLLLKFSFHRFVRENIFVKYLVQMAAESPTVRVGRTFWTKSKKFNEGMKSGMKETGCCWTLQALFLKNFFFFFFYSNKKNCCFLLLCPTGS